MDTADCAIIIFLRSMLNFDTPARRSPICESPIAASLFGFKLG